jgi:L-amino acid N-acyltransferase YncA
MKILKVEHNDAAQIAEIYNYYVLNTHHSFEQEAITVDEMLDRIDSITESCPFLVCVNDLEILGFAYAVHYKPRSAYRHSVEVSVYVKPHLEQKGIGTKLYETLFEEISKMDVHAIIAGISLPNDPSIKLHENFGFEKVAHFREVGFKMNRWIDVGYWELIRRKQ